MGAGINGTATCPGWMRRFISWLVSPTGAVPCDEIRQGYRKYYQGRHVIFYRQAGEDIEIIRILHERMDIEARLSE